MKTTNYMFGKQLTDKFFDAIFILIYYVQVVEFWDILRPTLVELEDHWIEEENNEQSLFSTYSVLDDLQCHIDD